MFTSVAELDNALTAPSAELVSDLADRSGDLVILGAGGKMGPTLAMLARRALDKAGRSNDEVFAVSRWSDAAAAGFLRDHRVRIVVADLVADGDLGGLPDAGDVVFMVGSKFGSSAAPSLAWAVNAALPDRVARRYAGSRIGALSTGNVYPFVPVDSGGSVESDPLGPVGEYAMSCLGRERVFEYAAATWATPIALVRLNYAVDLRYGVLADIGRSILSGTPVDLATPVVNVVWQGYANEIILRCLSHAAVDPFVVNLTGPETLSIRSAAELMATELDREVTFTGEPSTDALLADAAKCHQLFGTPPVPALELARWQAQWLGAGLPTSGKATKFAVRDGRF